MIYSGVTFISGANDDRFAERIGNQFAGATVIATNTKFQSGQILVLLGGPLARETDLKAIYNGALAYIHVIEGNEQNGFIDGSLRVICTNDLYNNGAKVVANELQRSFNKGLNKA